MPKVKETSTVRVYLPETTCATVCLSTVTTSAVGAGGAADFYAHVEGPVGGEVGTLGPVVDLMRGHAQIHQSALDQQRQRLWSGRCGGQRRWWRR